MSRATRGRSLVHSSERHQHDKDSLGEVLLDLMHFAAADGKDFDSELAWARQSILNDQNFPPLGAAKARDLRPGDKVEFEGRLREIVSVEHRGKEMPYFRFKDHFGSEEGNWYSWKLCGLEAT